MASCRTTLLDLIRALQMDVDSDAEVVAVIKYLVNSGRVVLSGSFSGRRFDELRGQIH